MQVLQRNLEKELDSINRQIAKIQEELKNMKDIEAQVSMSLYYFHLVFYLLLFDTFIKSSLFFLFSFVKLFKTFYFYLFTTLVQNVLVDIC